METCGIVLVKYALSTSNPKALCSMEYFGSIFCHLETLGVIKNLRTYRNPDVFHGVESTNYTLVKNGAQSFCFDCEERRDVLVSFTFYVNILVQTHASTKVLYVEISSPDYKFDIGAKTNCLEIIKHRIRNEISDFKTRYCLFDKQSQFYATSLYPLIHETENLFREYINDVFIKVFGPDWWNSYVVRTIKEKCEDRIKDTRDNTSSYKDIQPYLLSLEFMQLKTLAETKLCKWVPKYDKRIEDRLNKHSNEDIVPLLLEQTIVEFDLWSSYFGQYLPNDFLLKYTLLEKRRNQIAHNKLLDIDGYTKTKELCEQICKTLKQAYDNFKLALPSNEEKQQILEIGELIRLQEKEYEKLIAESETGVSVHNSENIVSQFRDTLQKLYETIIEDLFDRNDINFSELIDISDGVDYQEIFSIAYKIDSRIITIHANVEVVDSQGAISTLNIKAEESAATLTTQITFCNGEYEYSFEQGCYLPISQDEINKGEFDMAIYSLESFIEKRFHNLRSVADSFAHLSAMGKAESVVEDVECCECSEPYICIEEALAPAGVCLNCGARNKIIYCYFCGAPIESICASDYDEDCDEEVCEECKERFYDED